MSVDRNEKIWAYSNTGTRMHAFVQVWKDKDGNESTEYLRALCRGTIARHKGAVFSSANYAIGVCTRCEKLANAMWNRAEASMEQADPYSDGFHTVDETTADANRETEKKLAVEADDVWADYERSHAEYLANKQLDAAHAEALEMDAAGEALTAAHRDAMTLLEPEEKPKRWHYRARRMTSQGAFLGVVEGYLTAQSAVDVERHVRAEYDHPDRQLGNFYVRPAQ